MSESVPGPSGARPFAARFTGALMLDATVYEEVEHDPTAMGQAAAIVAIGAVANGIGAMGAGASGLIGGIVFAFVAWVLGAATIWLVGVRMMGHTSDMAELLRTLGFASAPRVLAILGILPLVGWIAGLAVAVLSLVAWVIAARQALDVTTGRAVVICLLALVVQIVLASILAALGIGVASMPA